MQQDRTRAYRCQIPTTDSACRIRIGSKKQVVCEMMDLSREDFRLRVPSGYEKAMHRAKRIELCFRGECWLVRCNKQATADVPGVVVLDRIEEVTPVKLPSPWTTLFSLQMSRNTDPRFVLTLMLAFISACIALPGIGDKLGTAPKIKNGVHQVIRSFE